MKTMQTMMIAMMTITAVALAEPPAPPPATAAPAPVTSPRPTTDMARDGMRRAMMGDPAVALMRMLSPDSPVAKELGLTDEQMQQIRATMTPSAEDMRDMNAKMEQLSARQADLLNVDPLDEEAILKVVHETGDLRNQMTEKRVKQLIAAYKLLTPEQRAKVRDLAKQHMDQARQRMSMPGAGVSREHGPRTPPPPPPASQPAPPQP